MSRQDTNAFADDKFFLLVRTHFVERHGNEENAQWLSFRLNPCTCSNASAATGAEISKRKNIATEVPRAHSRSQKMKQLYQSGPADDTS